MVTSKPALIAKLKTIFLKEDWTLATPVVPMFDNEENVFKKPHKLLCTHSHTFGLPVEFTPRLKTDLFAFGGIREQYDIESRTWALSDQDPWVSCFLSHAYLALVDVFDMTLDDIEMCEIGYKNKRMLLPKARLNAMSGQAVKVALATLVQEGVEILDEEGVDVTEDILSAFGVTTFTKAESKGLSFLAKREPIYHEIKSESAQKFQGDGKLDSSLAVKGTIIALSAFAVLLIAGFASGILQKWASEQADNKMWPSKVRKFFLALQDVPSLFKKLKNLQVINFDEGCSYTVKFLNDLFETFKKEGSLFKIVGLSNNATCQIAKFSFPGGIYMETTGINLELYVVGISINKTFSLECEDTNGNAIYLEAVNFVDVRGNS